MNLVISISVKKDGVLANADATPTLSDDSASFGVRRADTLDVIVAAATAMTAVATGRYQYTLTDAVAGVTYEYYSRVVINGQTYYTPGTISYAATAMSTYQTLGDAVALAATLPLLDQFSAASSDVQARALQLASLRIDQVRYQGRKYDAAQVRQFPRSDCQTDGTVTDWDDDTDTAVVPVNVKMAELYEAESIIAGDFDRITHAIATGIVSQSTGSLSESYRQSSGELQSALRLHPETTRLLSRYLLRSGRLL
ncbi:MAG TPA: hypothetical protein PLD59_11510 [Tepidisphaeraceae bacterium]|jgi:hypothetical protein|nr:hypothetical protein [Tepidisphaeraceae bacterium]